MYKCTYSLYPKPSQSVLYCVNDIVLRIIWYCLYNLKYGGLLVYYLCSLEDDALMDPFNIYLQTMLSQALASDFLQSLDQQNGEIQLHFSYISLSIFVVCPMQCIALNRI